MFYWYVFVLVSSVIIAGFFIVLSFIGIFKGHVRFQLEFENKPFFGLFLCLYSITLVSIFIDSLRNLG